MLMVWEWREQEVTQSIFQGFTLWCNLSPLKPKELTVKNVEQFQIQCDANYISKANWDAFIGMSPMRE